MLSPEKLAKAIDTELQTCRDADPVDAPGRTHQILEAATLLRHLGWTRNAGDNQAELERVIQSLKRHEVVRGSQHWRELARDSSRSSQRPIEIRVG